MHETEFIIISTHIGNSVTGSCVTPATLGDKEVQQLQKKVLQWKDCIQRERKEPDHKTKILLAMEARMSQAKSLEISKLRNDLEQAVQEKEVQIIILFLHILHALSYCHAYCMCNGSWI